MSWQKRFPKSLCIGVALEHCSLCSIGAALGGALSANQWTILNRQFPMAGEGFSNFLLETQLGRNPKKQSFAQAIENLRNLKRRQGGMQLQQFAIPTFFAQPTPAGDKNVRSNAQP
jgi:hypothetical protein